MHRSAASFASLVSSPWFARVALGAALVVGGAAWLFACSNQGEGDRCDIAGGNNGNDECQSDLVCTAKTQLSSNPLTDICCPPNLANATTQVCAQSVLPNFDASTPDSAGDAAQDAASSDGATDAATAPDAAGSDAAPDAASTTTDAGADAVSDAPANG